MHQNMTVDQQKKFGVDFIQKYSEGCLVCSTMQWGSVLARMDRWHVFGGYDIYTRLWNRWW
jgi:hypothetical protein